MNQITTLIIATLCIVGFIGGVSLISHFYSLNNIKSKTVGNGQHGTARFATRKEIKNTYKHIKFTPRLWRKGKNLPQKDEQGIIVGTSKSNHGVTALVDTADVHCLMIGASGAGKTAYFLYPNIEYSCASGVSFLTTDTKKDLLNNYGYIAEKYYGYNVSVIDLRNPTMSDGNNLLYLSNKYMDNYLNDNNDIISKAKAEKYAKITAKTIINTSDQSMGQNQFFYDAAEGLLTCMILIVAEFLAPENGEEDTRHIISVFKLVQELASPSNVKGKNQFQLLMAKLPENHKAKWLSGAALNTSEQAMASVLSTILSRLNAFLDSELETILCSNESINAEMFCNEKSAVFIVLPEEDASKFFMVSLIIQQLYRELLVIADEKGGKLDNRVLFFCDELGTLPPIQSLELIFSASRSRKISIVPIIQSIAQLKKNYGDEGSEIIIDNTQTSIFGGFAPNSKTAEILSKSLGSRTVMSGSVSQGSNAPSKSLQMIERPLLTSDELKSIPKGNFIVMKTGTNPMKTKLPLFLDWGIKFEKQYTRKESKKHKICYADKKTLEQSITKKYTGKSENKSNNNEEISAVNKTLINEQTLIKNKGQIKFKEH